MGLPRVNNWRKQAQYNGLVFVLFLYLSIILQRGEAVVNFWTVIGLLCPPYSDRYSNLNEGQTQAQMWQASTPQNVGLVLSSCVRH